MAALTRKSSDCVVSFCPPSISDPEKDVQLTCYLSQLFDSFVNLVPYDQYIHQNEFYSDENTNDSTSFKAKHNRQQGRGPGKIRQYSLNCLLSTTNQLRESITKQRNMTQKLKIQIKKQKKNAAEEKNKGGSILNSSVDEFQIKQNLTREELRSRLHAKIEALQHKKEKLKNEDYEGNLIGKKFKHQKQKDSKWSEKLKKRKIEDMMSKKDESIDTSNLQFGSFTFSKPVSETAVKLMETGKPGAKAARIRSAVKQLESEKFFLDNLDDEQRKEAVRMLSVKRALQKAEGIKVKDNLSRLRKAEKMRLKKKHRNAEKWKSRQEEPQKQQIEGKYQTKLEKSKQNGRKNRPGFEGKRSGFLNS